MRWVARALGVLLLVGAVGWGILALVYTGPAPPALAKGLATLYGAGGLAALVFLRPLRRAVAVVGLGFAAVLAWFFALPASNDRDWATDTSRPPWGEVKGDVLVMHDLRSFDYRTETDYTPAWVDRTYDLSKITGLDLFLVYWGSPQIAHTILSFTFADAPPLAVSIETRREKTESYSAIAGFFRQYEVFYVAADERDVVRLRSNYRGENVFLYRLRAPPDLARALLLDYVATMNRLRERPEWYNALTENCTTTIRIHTQNVSPGLPWDWRLLANGHLNEMLYERGSLDTRVPFDELVTRSSVDWRAKWADRDPDFSARIREGVPDPRDRDGS